MLAIAGESINETIEKIVAPKCRIETFWPDLSLRG
jgi:hypothetical protein